MLQKIKAILNSIPDHEIDQYDIWVNGNSIVDSIIIENENIVLVTSSEEIKLNDVILKESEE